MSPIGDGVLSLTKFYRIRALATELAHVAPGMASSQVRGLLGPGHAELADDLILYSDNDAVVDDPLLQACRAAAPSARILIWVGLVMADTRIAEIVEDYLTNANGKLIPTRFNTDRLEGHLVRFLPGRQSRKPATNILSYLRDSGIVEPEKEGPTIIGISSTNSTTPFVRDAVRYIMFRLQHLEIDYPLENDDADVALALEANHWLNLTPKEFRAAYDSSPPDEAPEPPEPPPPPPGGDGAPPVATEVDVEAHNTESFEVSGQSTRTAVRREQPLVVAYKAWMVARGSEMIRFRFRPPGTPAHLFNDIYDKTRGNLIEGKADATRPSIRMAIGQLMDYRRFAPAAARLAILTPRRPHRDLEDLLRSLDIACIWRQGDDFVDNADGSFV
jgi:hypothetical protein